MSDNKPESNVNTNVVKSNLPQSKSGLGSDHSDLIALAIKYFRIVGLVFFVWLLGYFGFSVAWILFATFAYVWRERTRNAREMKAQMIRAIQLDEKNAIIARLDEVPSWVYFPDRERVEWVNKILKQVWPYFRVYMGTIFRSTIEPIIQAAVPATLGKIRFDRIDFGDIPPRIGSIKVYTDKVLKDEIMMDLEVLYAGDAKIKVEMKKIMSGIKSIQFQGELRVILKPLCDKIPFFAALSAFFLRSPTIDFDLTEAANAFDLPILSDTLRTTIVDIFDKILVLPNRLVIPIIPDYHLLNTSYLTTPHPKGVLRIHVIRASDLKRVDVGLLKAGKSDPYVKISGIGNREYQTKVIEDNLNPEWNESFDIPLEDIEGNSTVNLSIFDKDIKNDDFLGGVTIDIQQVIEKGVEEGTYTLKNIKHGQLQLKLEWFYLSNDAEVLRKSQKDFNKQKSLPIALLLVHLKSASDIPNIIKKNGGLTEPNCTAILKIGDQKQSSITTINTTSPQWNQNFVFMLDNPDHQNLNIIINEQKTGKDICTGEIRISEILKEDKLTMSREFDLKCAETNYEPKAFMILKLRIYSREICKFDDDENANVSDNTKVRDEDSPEIETKTNVANMLSANPDEVIDTQGLRQRALSAIHEFVEKKAEDFGFGKIQLTIHYRMEEHKFVVTVHSCRGLSSFNQKSLPDPYIRLFLHPDSKSKKRTKSIKDNLNPNYEETFEWDISHNDLKRRKLQVSIKNEKPFLSNETVYMGEVLIDLEKMDLAYPVKKWFPINESVNNF